MATFPVLMRDPLRVVGDMGRLVDEVFRSFGNLDVDVAPSFGRSDIYVKDKHLIVETELPGARKEDIQVKVEGNKLIVAGEVKRCEEVREENFIRMGRHCGTFRRVFPLPDELENAQDVKAKFADGILRIEVPLRRAPNEERGFDVKIQ